MKAAAAIIMIGLVVLTAHAWTVPLLDNQRVLAFVLSDSFLQVMAGGIALAIAAALGLVMILAFTPSLSGRTEPEGGE